MIDRLIFEYHGRDPLGMPRISCHREGGGLMGWGASNGLALADFEAKEDELVPTPKEREVEDAINEGLSNGN